MRLVRYSPGLLQNPDLSVMFRLTTSLGKVVIYLVTCCKIIATPASFKASMHSWYIDIVFHAALQVREVV